MIYKATNNINGKVYIGQTIQSLDTRISQHSHDARRGVQNYFYKAIRKYGFDNFYWIILNQCDDIDTMNLLEQYYIEYYDSMEEGYNLRTGGKNSLHSEESKKKMSKAAKLRFANGKNSPMYGKNHSEETKKKISKSNVGKKFSLITRKRISDANIGKTISAETRKKISINSKSRTTETRQKMSKAHIGKKLSIKTRNKISESLMGHSVSDESRKKMRGMRKKRNKNLDTPVTSKTEHPLVITSKKGAPNE